MRLNSSHTSSRDNMTYTYYVSLNTIPQQLTTKPNIYLVHSVEGNKLPWSEHFSSRLDSNEVWVHTITYSNAI